MKSTSTSVDFSSDFFRLQISTEISPPVIYLTYEPEYLLEGDVVPQFGVVPTNGVNPNIRGGGGGDAASSAFIIAVVVLVLPGGGGGGQEATDEF